MSSLLEADVPFADHVSGSKRPENPRDRITCSFNVILFAVQCGLGLFQFLMSGRAHGVPSFGILVTVAADFVRVSALIFLSALLIQAFWRRLLPSLTGVRSLEYREAVAIALMIGILFG